MVYNYEIFLLMPELMQDQSICMAVFKPSEQNQDANNEQSVISNPYYYSFWCLDA